MGQSIELWPIDKLIPYARNPRKNDHAVDSIAAAIKEFGFRIPILAKSDGLVVDGHLRLKAAKKLSLGSVPVMLCDDMTENQIKAFRISVNRMAELADWDADLLKLELQDLEDQGLDVSISGFDDIDAIVSDDFAEQEKEKESDNNYTRKIEAPIYEPKGDKPKLSDLVDTTKTQELLKEINAAKIPEEEKEFLRLAAARHTVFNYDKIANYYAHSDATVQNLMENSALVIIDFNKAIELGFVKMTKELSEVFENEK